MTANDINLRRVLAVIAGILAVASLIGVNGPLLAVGLLVLAVAVLL